MTDKIVPLIKPEETTREVFSRIIKDIDEEHHPNLVQGKKCFSVVLDDTNNGYSLSTYSTGMRTSEVIALLEVLKARCLVDMGYLADGS